MVFDTMTFEESVDLLEYMDDTEFLQENGMDKSINFYSKSIVKHIKEVTKKMQNAKSEEDMENILKDLDQCYEELIALKKRIKKDIIMSIVIVSIFGILIAFFPLIMSSFYDLSAKSVISETKFISSYSKIVMIFGIIINLVNLNRLNTLDTAYQVLVKIESEAMVNKRKAKQEKDKKTEDYCDKLIEIVEDFKVKRRKDLQEEAKKKANNVNESYYYLLDESQKVETNINNFKQSLDELNIFMNNAFEHIKVVYGSCEYITKKALSINEKNKDSITEDIKNEVNKCTDSYKAIDEDIPIFPQFEKLISKFDKFSTKYSKYGLKVREKFEKRLIEFNKRVVDYINESMDTLCELTNQPKGSNINSILDILETRVYESCKDKEKTDVILNTFCSIYNSGLIYLGFIYSEMDWAYRITKASNIKQSLRYKLFRKLVK